MISFEERRGERRFTAFDELYEFLPGDGWLSKVEAELLWKWVNVVEGDILEVGCYKGRSTVLLTATDRRVLCVDPFKGFSTDDPSGLEIYKTFLANLKERRVENFSLFVTRVEDWTPKSVGFAYLDGDHTYQGTKVQIVVALKCEAKIIAIHDVNDSGGGLEVKRASLEMLGNWTERKERLAIWDLRSPTTT